MLPPGEKWAIVDAFVNSRASRYTYGYMLLKKFVYFKLTAKENYLQILYYTLVWI